MVSNTKLLDAPLGLSAMVSVSFHCDTWTQFENTVEWLIKNGVGLTFNEHRIFMNGRRPFVNGAMVTRKRENPVGWVDGEESDIRYTVFMPESLR